MIRRDALSVEGSPCWILVPQIEHAHLAGTVADAWQLDELGPDVCQDLRLAAFHHDDGWYEWDFQPGLDLAGVPVAFDAMRPADFVTIWNRSIELAVAHGPLVGFLVAGHFTRLLERFSSWRANPEVEPIGVQFLDDQRSRMAHWLGDWQSQNPAIRLPKLAERGVSFLQMFDAISLWLCCAERSEPWSVSMPEGGGWTLSPNGAQKITISPWPLRSSQITLVVNGRLVPRAKYGSTEELLAVASQQVTLRWTLCAPNEV